jgi:hypothetical protein
MFLPNNKGMAFHLTETAVDFVDHHRILQLPFPIPIHAQMKPDDHPPLKVALGWSGVSSPVSRLTSSCRCSTRLSRWRSRSTSPTRLRQIRCQPTISMPTAAALRGLLDA